MRFRLLFFLIVAFQLKAGDEISVVYITESMLKSEIVLAEVQRRYSAEKAEVVGQEIEKMGGII